MDNGSLFQVDLMKQDYLPQVVAYYYKQWNGYQMPFHAHNATEIMYMISGVCRIDIEQDPNSQRSVALKKGEFILLDANVSHRLIVEEEMSCRMLNIEFRFIAGKGLFPSLKELASADIVLESLLASVHSFLVLRDPDEVYHILKSLVLELDKRLDRNGLMVQLLLSQLLIRIARLQQETETNKVQQSEFYVKQSIDFLHQNYDREIQIKDIASVVNIHPGYLQRIFKQQMGCTLTEYLMVLRMEKAKMLLHQTDISVIEIADYVGVASRQYFHLLFKKYTNQTPVEFRKSKETVNWDYPKA